MRERIDARDPAVERAHFEAVAAAKGALYWADRTAAGRRRRDIRAGLLMTLAGAGAGARILEIGCGMGEYTRAFAALTRAALVAVDVAPAVAARARRKAGAGAHVAAADVEALPFADRTFDVVTGNAVLHHLRLDRAVPEIVRVLRPGGRLCFAEPNLLNPHVFLEKKIPWIGRWLDDSPGETAFVRWRLRRDLERRGLLGVSIRPFDFLYPAVPARIVPAVEALGRVLERTPLVREIAGSLLIVARTPAEETAGPRETPVSRW
jgi:SAM-dependent methyltransferase